MKPSRPLLRYYGGKFKIAPWIVSFFPEHGNYLEGTCGASSVLFYKDRAKVETINDIDNELVHFLMVLRDFSDILAEKIRKTPWARSEYELALIPTDDSIERARRYYVRSWMSYGGKASGWRMTTDWRKRWSPAAADMVRDDWDIFAERLIGVQIENRNVFDIIAKYSNDDCLRYIDPPYPKSTRANKDKYVVEWKDDDHENLFNLLSSTRGYAIVSGYQCDLYKDTYENAGWHREDRLSQTNSGGSRVESLWISPITWDALAQMSKAPRIVESGNTTYSIPPLFAE